MACRLTSIHWWYLIWWIEGDLLRVLMQNGPHQDQCQDECTRRDSHLNFRGSRCSRDLPRFMPIETYAQYVGYQCNSDCQKAKRSNHNIDCKKSIALHCSKWLQHTGHIFWGIALKYAVVGYLNPTQLQAAFVSCWNAIDDMSLGSRSHHVAF